LLESDAARREFWQRASLHGWSYTAAKLNYGAKTAPELAKERRELRGVSFGTFLQRLKWAGGFAWKAALVGGFGCALAWMLWLGIHSFGSRDDEALVADTNQELPFKTDGIAALTRGTGVVWEKNGAEIGSVLAPGWLHLKSGAVQVEFFSGARVILEGPAA